MSAPSDRMLFDSWSGVPIGLTPDGTMVFSYLELPPLLVPTRIVIHPAFFEVDGWILSYSGICKGTLIWLMKRLEVWMQSSPDLIDAEWCEAIVDRLNEAVAATA